MPTVDPKTGHGELASSNKIAAADLAAISAFRDRTVRRRPGSRALAFRGGGCTRPLLQARLDSPARACERVLEAGSW
jgi:hypothetical protein